MAVLMDKQIIISEAFGITTSLGALVRVVGLVIAATIAYMSLKTDISEAKVQSLKNEMQIQTNTILLDHTRMDVNTVGSKFDEFMRSYDRDMNRYIREKRDQR